jgi:hypothetical protein
MKLGVTVAPLVLGAGWLPMYMRCGAVFVAYGRNLRTMCIYLMSVPQGPYRTNVKDLNGNVIGTKVTFNAIIDGRRSITRM